MKIKEGFKLKFIHGKCFVEPSEEEAHSFNKVIELDNSGKLLFEELLVGSSEEKLIKALMDNYKVNIMKAKKDVNQFLQILKLNNLIEE